MLPMSVSNGQGVAQLARSARVTMPAALDEYARLGVDDVIVGLRPRDRTSLDRLVAALELRQG